MSNNATNYLESGLYNHLLRNSTFSKPVNICIALTSNNPQDQGDNGGVFSELSGNGYTRAPGCSGNVFWEEYKTALEGGYNLQEITFPQATADWGYVSGVVVFDAFTGGNPLLAGPLTTPRIVLNEDQFVIRVSGISLFVL